jgi:tetratricopeptide (TPR) repeat protein
MTVKKVLIGLGCCALLSACGVTEEVPEYRGDGMGQAQKISSTPEGTALMTEAGMIHIQRHTPGYTISMMLDATDDNVYFVMDLPPEELEKQKKEKEAQEEPVEDDVAEDEESEKPQEGAATRASKHVLYAQTYFFERKYDRAMNEIDRAIDLDPSSAVAYSLKGSIHFKQGEKSRAKKAWEKSIELDSNQEDVQKMLDSLK